MTKTLNARNVRIALWVTAAAFSTFAAFDLVEWALDLGLQGNLAYMTARGLAGIVAVHVTFSRVRTGT